MRREGSTLIIESACELIDIIMTIFHEHPDETEVSFGLWKDPSQLLRASTDIIDAASSIDTSRINEVSLDDPESMYEIGFFSCINFTYDNSGRLSLKNDGRWKEAWWVGVDGLRDFITKDHDDISRVECEFNWKESFGRGSSEHERFIHHLNILKL